MAKKVPYLKLVLDCEDTPVTVGCRIAYAVRVGNSAELRIGVVQEINEAPPPYWRRDEGSVPSIVAAFKGNSKASTIGNLDNLVVLS